MGSPEIYDEDDELLGILDKKPTISKLAGEESSASPTVLSSPTVNPPSPTVNPPSPTVATDTSAKTISIEEIDAANPIKIKAQLEAKDFLLPSLMGSDYPSAYEEVVDRMLFQYKYLPELDHDAIFLLDMFTSPMFFVLEILYNKKDKTTI